MFRGSLDAGFAGGAYFQRRSVVFFVGYVITNYEFTYEHD
jgi:hypothetical protein